MAFPITYQIVLSIAVISNDGTSLALNENQNPKYRTREVNRIYLLKLIVYPRHSTIVIAVNIGNGIVIMQ